MGAEIFLIAGPHLTPRQWLPASIPIEGWATSQAPVHCTLVSVFRRRPDNNIIDNAGPHDRPFTDTATDTKVSINTIVQLFPLHSTGLIAVASCVSADCQGYMFATKTSSEKGNP